MSTLSVALLQSATRWHDPAANRVRFEELLDQVPAGTDLVVLPEMFSTGFTMASADQAETMQGETVAWLRARAAATGAHLCGSLVIAAAANDYRNRLLWVTPAGELTWYDKRHRFRMAGEHDHYTAGNDRVVVNLGPTRILLQVCYDLRFPVFSRNTGDYDLYLLVANWPAARARHWHTLLAARAIENQCHVVAVNCLGTDGNGVGYNGGSTVIDPEGRPLLMAGSVPGAFTAQLDFAAQAAYRQRFPAWQDADGFTMHDLD